MPATRNYRFNPRSVRGYTAKLPFITRLSQAYCVYRGFLLALLVDNSARGQYERLAMPVVDFRDAILLAEHDLSENDFVWFPRWLWQRATCE